MPEWSTERYRLRDGHNWKAKPGYKIFVADGGAVRFDFPADWVVVPGEDSIRFLDRPEPDDACLLQVSVMRLPRGIDWSGLPLTRLLAEVIAGDERDVVSQGEIRHVRRGDLEIAWTETRFIDPTERREACSRCCLARRVAIQPLITMVFWPEDAARFGPVWDEVLRSLRVGEVLADPRRVARN